MTAYARERAARGYPGHYNPTRPPVTPPPKGHSCAACPVEVRVLYAIAANASRAFAELVRGRGDITRAYHKSNELATAVEQFSKTADAHFAFAERDG